MSGAEGPGPLTILVRDLEVGPASTATLGLARWLADRGAEAEVVSIWGGPRRDALDAVSRLHVVNDDQRWDSGRVLASLDLPRLATSARAARTRRRLGAGAAAQTAVRAMGAVGLSRAAEATRSTALRGRLRGPSHPVIVMGAGAARLAHYLPAHRSVLAVLPAGDGDPTGLAPPEDLRALGARCHTVVVGAEDDRRHAAALGAERPVEVVPDLLVVDTEPGRDAVRRQLRGAGLVDGDPLVVSVGTIDWWEQPDGFVAVAWELRRRGRRAALVWAAGPASERMLWPLRHDLAHAGLDDVLITGVDPPPLAVLAAADVILLARRGEVPPWVLVEARLAGVPVVRWAATDDEAPGRRDGEIIVAHLDDRALADAVEHTLDDPVVGPQVAEAARALRQRHGPDAIASRLVALAARQGPAPP